MRFMCLLCVMLILTMLPPCAIAEDAIQRQLSAPADMQPDDVRMFVEAMFAASVGTSTDHETDLRADMTYEELEARNAANSEYRARTRPWLEAVFSPEYSPEAPAPTAASAAEMQHDAETQETLPRFTPHDSFVSFAETIAGMEYLALMANMGGESYEACLLLSRSICSMWMAQIDHEMLSGMNPDYLCWIHAPATQIDYPVVQCEDNSSYLKRMFNGERNSAGTLFIDYRNLPDFRDPNTLIYGHHMRNDSMFGSLTDYADQAYFESHPIMLLMTPDEMFLLEIFAGYTTSDKDHCYDIAISDEDDMAAFIEEAQNKSDFVSDVHIDTTDRLVTLSTCAYAFENARYILIAKIVPVQNNEIQKITPLDDDLPD